MDAADSSIAALCYARTTGIDFQDLAADLARAMWTGKGGVRLDMPTEGVAICDMPGMRIGVARAEMWRTFPGAPTARAYPECILLSVGPGTDRSHDIQEIVSFDQVRDALVYLVQDNEAADRVLLFEGPGAYDAEAVDEMIDELRNHLDREIGRAPQPQPVAVDRQADIVIEMPAAATAARAAPEPRFEPTPLDRILDAVEKPMLEVVMARAGGNQSRAAEWLGINRNTLRRKLAEHKLLK